MIEPGAFEAQGTIREEEMELYGLPFVIKTLIFLSMVLVLCVLFGSPGVVLVGIVGVAFLAAGLIEPFLAFVGFVLISAGNPGVFIKALRSVHVVRVLGLAALFSWMLRMVLTKDFSITKDRTTLYAVAFFVACLLATHQNWSVSKSYAIEVIKAAITYFLAVNLIKGRGRLIFMAVLLVFVGAGLGAGGVVQYLKYGATIVGAEEPYRVSAVIADPNDYAAHLVPALTLGITLTLALRNKLGKLILTGLTGFILLGIILSFSRGGTIALAVATLSLVLLLRVRPAVLVWSGILGVVLLILAPPEYKARMATITNFQDPAILSRIYAWIAAIRMFITHPIFGVGLGNEIRYFIQYIPPANLMIEKLTTHNTYFQILADTGILGIVPFVLVIKNIFSNLSIARHTFVQQDQMLHKLSIGLTAGLLGYLAGHFFLSHMGWRQMFWIVVGLSVVLKELAMSKPQQEEEEAVEEVSETKQSIG